jgi:FdhD protein
MSAIEDWSIQPYAEVAVRRCVDGSVEEGLDLVAEEVPVALEYNGISHAVMLASPLHLEDFAIGFSLTEGIVQRRSEIYECEVLKEPVGMRVVMRISAERFAGLKERRRSLAGRTGCGLCGTESLEHAVRTPPAVTSDITLASSALYLALQRMQEQQLLQQKTGAVHAAAWISLSGQVGTLREDVGRHNALDKVIGALAGMDIDASQGAIIVTSRASYEMVQKTASAGIGLMAAISAPTALAVRLAQQCNVTLIGFARGNRHVIYTHPHRINN